MPANGQRPPADPLPPVLAAGPGLRTFWVFAGLNLAVLLPLLALLRWVQPEWFSFPTHPTLALGGSIVALAAATVAGTWLAWNSLTPMDSIEAAARTRPRLRHFLWNGMGSGAAAGLVFLLVILMLFYVPRHGLRAIGGLMPWPAAILAGAGIGGLMGCFDYLVCRVTVHPGENQGKAPG